MIAYYRYELGTGNSLSTISIMSCILGLLSNFKNRKYHEDCTVKKGPTIVNRVGQIPVVAKNGLKGR